MLSKYLISHSFLATWSFESSTLVTPQFRHLVSIIGTIVFFLSPDLLSSYPFSCIRIILLLSFAITYFLLPLGAFIINPFDTPDSFYELTNMNGGECKISVDNC